MLLQTWADRGAEIQPPGQVEAWRNHMEDEVGHRNFGGEALRAQMLLSQLCSYFLEAAYPTGALCHWKWQHRELLCVLLLSPVM